VTLPGDACHPTTPYTAQGAIEDAALSRCLEGVGCAGVTNAFRRFEASRKPRTSRVQQTSRTNTWLKDKTDTDWVYAYDARTTPLAA
jgi:salicylate hydroxylase/6-hydroxynicotinate 3-monooxygenase